MDKSSRPELKIFSGSAHRDLAQRIADYIGIPLGDASVKSFPDGETSVRINENIRGRDVFIIQPTCPPVNHNLMELLVLVDAARRASAARITAVMPFLWLRAPGPQGPAARADHGQARGQSHHGGWRQPGAHGGPARAADSRFLRHPRGPSVRAARVPAAFPHAGHVAPGRSSRRTWAASRSPILTRRRCTSPLATVAKKRKSDTEVDSSYLIGDVADRNVLLVDDLTTTAGTITSAARICKEHGAQVGPRGGDARRAHRHGGGAAAGLGDQRTHHHQQHPHAQGAARRLPHDGAMHRGAAGRGHQAHPRRRVRQRTFQSGQRTGCSTWKGSNTVI